MSPFLIDRLVADRRNALVADAALSRRAGARRVDLAPVARRPRWRPAQRRFRLVGSALRTP